METTYTFEFMRLAEPPSLQIKQPSAFHVALLLHSESASDKPTTNARKTTFYPVGRLFALEVTFRSIATGSPSLASERRPGGKGRTVLPELLQTLAQNEQGIGDALVFFAGFLDLAVSHEVLEFIVSAQPQHFLAAAGGIPSPESRMNDAEKGFELIGFRARKGRHQLLSDIVGAATGEGAEI